MSRIDRHFRRDYGYDPADREWINITAVGDAYEHEMCIRTKDRRHRPVTFGGPYVPEWKPGPPPQDKERTSAEPVA